MKIRKALAILLSAAMIFSGFSSMGSVFAAENAGETAAESGELEFEKLEGRNILSGRKKQDESFTESELTEAQLIREDGTVRVSIVLDGKSTIDSGYSTQGIAHNQKAQNYRAGLLRNQKSVAEKISKEALGGKKLDVVWNLTLAANIISANVPYEKVWKIKGVSGVKEVVIENYYSAPVAETNGDEPTMASSQPMTGTDALVNSGYTGAGSKVAIIDTGLDTDHKSFSAAAFDYAISQSERKLIS